MPKALKNKDSERVRIVRSCLTKSPVFLLKAQTESLSLIGVEGDELLNTAPLEKELYTANAKIANAVKIYFITALRKKHSCR